MDKYMIDVIALLITFFIVGSAVLLVVKHILPLPYVILVLCIFVISEFAVHKIIHS